MVAERLVGDAPAAIAPSHAGLNFLPSTSNATGVRKQNASTVRTAYKLAGVMLSPTGLPICFFPMMPRSADAVLDPIAFPNATHEKDSSLRDASDTPAMMGRSETYTGRAKVCPRMMAEKPAVKTGSAAFTICVKETAPAPSARTAVACAAVWSSANWLRAGYRGVTGRG